MSIARPTKKTHNIMYKKGDLKNNRPMLPIKRRLMAVHANPR
jgi:hypothetical protein